MTSDVVVPLAITVLTLAGGWLVTTRVSDHWDQIKRRREADQAAAQEFQRLYGEFYATWQSWNAIAKGDIHVGDKGEATRECLDRSARTEGELEALLAKIAAERELSDRDLAVLGAVRQGFKALRKAIRKEEPLPWWGSEVVEYTAFKQLAVYTSRLLTSYSASAPAPSNDEAIGSFRAITSNMNEKNWTKSAGELDSPDRTK